MRTILGALTILAISTSTVFAADPPAVAADPASRGIAKEAKEAPLRASNINGMKVINKEGKELGTVNDIVLDAATGKLRYAALSYGGFLGVGNKLFAVPWDQFEIRHEAGSGKFYLVLNLAEDKLKAAPGFDSAHWPDFADPKFTATLDTHYRGSVRK